MIILVQVPDLYAAVEEEEDPELRSRPILVGGHPSRRGSVTGLNAAARAAGACVGMAVREALDLCPEAAFRPTRLAHYRACAQAIRALVRQECERIEPFGLDGVLLEPPAAIDPLELAAGLCVRIQGDLGLPARAGIGPTRFVASVAAAHSGAAGLRWVRDGEERAFLAPLPLGELWGLGPATEEKLAALGVRTLGELAAMDSEALESVAGRNARRLATLARGEDREPLRVRARPKSYSQEETWKEPTRDLRRIGERLEQLAQRLAGVLERDRRRARTLALGVSYLDGESVTRTRTRREPFSAALPMRDLALELLGRTHAGVRSVRRVRLQVSNLTRGEGRRPQRQLELF
ncbi:MAG: hypothetical protein ACE5IL_04345 [Myxococcota bacterium]